MADHQLTLWKTPRAPKVRAEDPAARRRRQARERSRQYRRQHAFVPPTNIDIAPAPSAAVIDAIGRSLGEALAAQFTGMGEPRRGSTQTQQQQEETER